MSATESVGAWWNPALPGDVTQEQARVAAARAGVNTSLVSSAPAPSAETDAAIEAWAAVNAEIIDYEGEQPSAFWWLRDEQVNKGRDWEAVIESWRARFGKLGFAVPAAPPAPIAPSGGGLFGDLSGLSTPLLLLGAALLLHEWKR